MTAQRCWNSGFSSEMTSDKKQGKQDIKREAEGKSKNVSRWPTMCQALYICYLIEQDEIWINACGGLHYPHRTWIHFLNCEMLAQRALSLFFFHYNFCVNMKRHEFKDGASWDTSIRVPNIIKILLFIFLPKWLLPGGQQLHFLHSV